MTVRENEIRKAGAVIVNDGRVLVVRKRGGHQESTYIMPGGTLEVGEAPKAALMREIREELSVGVSSCAFMGRFEARAAIEDVPIVIYAYRVTLDGPPVPSSEIEEVRWISASDVNSVRVASIMATQVMPRLARSGAI